MKSRRFNRSLMFGCISFMSITLISLNQTFQKNTLGASEASNFPNCDLSLSRSLCAGKLKILVTGVSGFVGSHVAEKLTRLSDDFFVVGIDNFSAYGNSQRINIPKGITFREGDLTNEKFVVDIFRKDGPFDIVYHIAAYGGQGMSNFIRRTLYSKNTIVSANLINAAVNFGSIHFIFISSCAVYGSKAVAPLIEDAKILPDDPYGISKYATELDIHAAYKQFGLNYTIFRAHNVYGPRQFLNDPFRNVISIWLRQILLGQDITIFGSGEQTRSFTFIDDISSLITEAPFNFKARNQILNAGNENSVKLINVLHELGKSLEMKPKITKLPVRRETSEVQPDHDKQKRIFGGRDFTDLRDGIQQTITWARTIDWKTIGLAPHPFPEVNKSMPSAWLKLFDSGSIIPPPLPSSSETNTDSSIKEYYGDEKSNSGENRIGSYKVRSTCRFDGHPLIVVINFGLVPLANNFLGHGSTEKDFNNELLYPLTVGFDPYCGSFQVNVMPLAQQDVWKEYIYFSSVIQSLSNEFVEYAKEFSALFEKPESNKILEIGCNDGVFLKPLSRLGFNVIGVDPASNVVKKLKDDYVIYDTFFGEELAKKVLASQGNMNAIVSSNSFAHIDDMSDVMEGINLLLHSDGILAIQVHYVVSMVEKMQYDWIYHEHLSYYSLNSISNFLNRFSMQIFDAKETSMHGGSLRVFAQRIGGKRVETDSLKKIVAKEKNLSVDKLEFFTSFEKKMEQTRVDLRAVLTKFVQVEKKQIVGYGAPARATTLCAFIGLEFMKNHLKSVIDDSPAKQGSFMPGTHLKIVSSKILLDENRPDCVLLFAWPWVRDVVKKNVEFFLKGGIFIIPLPTVFIIDEGNFSEFL